MEILLVEDTPADVELAYIAIRRCHFEGVVTHLPDGERAIEWLARRDAAAGAAALPLPQLVLLDLEMPRLDGLEVLRRAKSSPRLRCVPMVMFTSSSDRGDMARAFELGANSYVVKPTEFARYCFTMEEMLRYWTRVSETPPYAGDE